MPCDQHELSNYFEQFFRSFLHKVRMSGRREKNIQKKISFDVHKIWQRDEVYCIVHYTLSNVKAIMNIPQA